MLRQLLPTLGAVLAAALCTASAGAADPAPSVDWLGGHWCSASGDETVEELWLPPHGGVAVGIARTRTGDETTGFEYLRIVDVDGAPAYVAQPGGRPPTVFLLTAAGERWLRFENPEHDFPQRIEYRREGDTLRAEIAGPGDDGEEVAIAFVFSACDTPVRISAGGAGSPSRR